MSDFSDGRSGSSELSRLGAAVAARLTQRSASADELTRARHGLQVALAERRRPWPAPASLVAFALAAVAALALVWTLRRAAPITYEIVGGQQEASGWLQANRDEIALSFSDSSTVLFKSGARARVVATDRRGAELALERGFGTLSIHHQPGTAWLVHAGPFDVRVVGTRFELGWDPEQRTFTLAVQDGRVLLDGPGHHSQPVIAGQHVEVSLAEPVSVPAGVLPAVGAARLPPEPGAEPAPSARGLPLPSPRTEPGAGAPLTPDWRALAASGHWQKAVDAAELAGFDELCASASQHDLLSLADAARLARRADRARQAYIVLRRRFPGSDDAALAAYQLGVLAFPAAEAVPPFESYLAERANGTLAPEALGRVLEVYQKLGDVSHARATAARYLERFPAGAHAALAERVLGR